MAKYKESHHIFHSFCLSPKLKFDGQHHKEEVILMLRAHPVTQISWILNGFFILLAIIGSNLIFHSFLNTFQIFFIDFFGLAIILSYFWLNFLLWYFNVGLVTSERILDIDFHPISYKEVTMALLSKVEDVTSKTGGFLSSFFDFGNVFVQTAGTEVNVEFLNVPKPAEVVKIINQLINES